jgi:hypothetical protein
MALILETTVRDAISNAIASNVDGGTGTATLVIQTVADGALATFNLNATAFTASTVGVIALAGTPKSDTNANLGTAAQFSIFNKSAVKQLEGTVGTGAQDITISSVAIGAGDTVQLTSFSITCPAS